MEILLFLGLWLAFCAAAGKMAENRKRSFGLWFFISLIFSPLISALILLMIGNAVPQQPAYIIQQAPLPAPPAHEPVRETRECPFCAETILAKAKVCKHCGREIEPIANNGMGEV